MSSFNFTIKRYRIVHWNEEKETIYYIQETHLTGKDIQKLRVKGWKSTYQENRSKKQVNVV